MENIRIRPARIKRIARRFFHRFLSGFKKATVMALLFSFAVPPFAFAQEVSLQSAPAQASNEQEVHVPDMNVVIKGNGNDRPDAEPFEPAPSAPADPEPIAPADETPAAAGEDASQDHPDADTGDEAAVELDPDSEAMAVSTSVDMVTGYRNLLENE